jgi:RND superfamily putative drug exporter
VTRRLERVGRAAAAHPWRVLAVWLLVALAVIGLDRTMGGEATDDMSIPGSETDAATELLTEHARAESGATASVVVHASEGTLSDPDHAAAMGASLDAVSALDHVGAVVPPSPDLGTVADDGATGFATVTYDVPLAELHKADQDALEEALRPAVDAGLQVEYGGDLNRKVERPEVGASDRIGLAVAAVVLVLVFGSFLAAGLPIVTALFGLGIGLGLVGLASAVIDVPSTSHTLATMIGLGVGIDYALFVVTRHREQVAAGLGLAESIGRANATAGQSVLFAGATVVIAICGLAIAGIPTVTALGLATALVVVVAMAAAVTLLPALLGILGLRATARRRMGRNTNEAGRSVWGRLAHRVGRRPWPYAVASVAVLLVLAVPTLSMELGTNDAGTLSTSSTQRRAYELVSDAFGPGFNGTLTVVGVLDEPGDRAAAEGLASELAARDGVAAVAPARLSPDGALGIVTVVPTTSPQDAATADLVADVRDDLGSGGAQGVGDVLVTGTVAGNEDLAGRIGERLPWFIGAVVAISFVLLMLVFRSVLVPLKAALMNLLSVGAAYGVVVAVFQWGWGASLVGMEETIPITPWVPMMMFAILFGLSMDYEVFLLSRVREAWLRSGDSRASVVEGVSSTASVITAAALIMVAVFASFVLVDDPVVKMMGLGLATAVLVDATVIRMVTVPASMELLGDTNWWLPRRLHRLLPHLDLESAPDMAGRAS